MHDYAFIDVSLIGRLKRRCPLRFPNVSLLHSCYFAIDSVEVKLEKQPIGTDMSRRSFSSLKDVLGVTGFCVTIHYAEVVMADPTIKSLVHSPSGSGRSGFH